MRKETEFERPLDPLEDEALEKNLKTTFKVLRFVLLSFFLGTLRALWIMSDED